MSPDRIVIGAFEEEDGDRVEALHAGIDAPVVRADVNSAEMIKLASNAFLSTRISFVNEIATTSASSSAPTCRRSPRVWVSTTASASTSCAQDRLRRELLEGRPR